MVFRPTVNRPLSTDGFALNPSLALYLPLWKKDGASIQSDSAYGSTCSVTGALWTPQGRRFDGIDDVIDIGTRISTLAPPLPITLIVWLNKQAGGGDGGGSNTGIIALNRSANIAGVGMNFGTKSGNTYPINLTYGDNTANYRVKTTTANVITDGGTYYIAGVIRGDTDMSLYVNGEDIGGTYSGTGGALAWNGGAGKIGLCIGNPNYYFKGTIGEVRVYLQNFTPQDIQRDYLSTKWRYQ